MNKLSQITKAHGRIVYMYYEAQRRFRKVSFVILIPLRFAIKNIVLKMKTIDVIF